MLIHGRVLEVETVSGQSDNGQPYSYQKAHILDGLEVVACRVSESFTENGGTLAKGSDLTAVCRVTPWVDRRGGGARLSVSLVAPYAVAARAAA